MKILFITIFIFFLSSVISAQTCPSGFICLSQEQANIAAKNARELEAQKNKVAVLEEAIKAEKQNTDDMREAKRKNEEELKLALHKTETELALKTGQLIGAEAMNVRLTAIVEFLLKYGRVKKYGINLF